MNTLPPLHSLLDESLAHTPEYGEGLSSHLPMALAALHALGAHEAQMRRFAGAYLQRTGLATRRATARPPALLADWQVHRGEFGAFVALQAHFAAALRAQGRDVVLREALPALLPGLAGAAFHGLIRTAHAVEAEHLGELAAALAYWAARWWPLPPGEARPGEPASGVLAWIVAVETSLQQHDAHWRSAAGLITGRMAEATTTVSYLALAEGPGPDAARPESLGLLAHDAARRFAQTGNFTVLHMATALRAAGVLARWCAPEALPVMFTALWRGWLAARIASATGPLRADEPVPAPATPWQELRQAACESDNDHTIKLVHAMDGFAHRPGAPATAAQPPWLAAACRALGRSG